MGWSFLIFTMAFAMGCQAPSGQVARSPSPPPSVEVSERTTAPPVTRMQDRDRARPRSNLLSRIPRMEGGEVGQEVAVRIRAMVNGKPIFDQEIETAAYQFLQQTYPLPEPEKTRQQRKIRKKVLDELIDREVILQDAFARLEKVAPQALDRLKKSASKDFEKRFVQGMMKGNGLTDRDKLGQFLAQRGLSLSTLKRQWVRNIISQEYLRSRALRYVEKINRKQLQEYYDSHPEEFEVKDSVEWQDIFVSNQRHGSRQKAKAVSEQLVAQVRAGTDFVELCKVYDDGDSALRNGNGIGKARGEIQPVEVENLLFSMRDGEVAPPIEMDHGYHVVRLKKRQYAGRKPFDQEVQRVIRQKLRSQIAGREMKRIVRELRNRSVIELAR